MAKCNCSGQTCSCRILAGEGITITGSGTSQDPWEISSAGAGGSGSSSFDPGDLKETVSTATSPGWLEALGQTVSRTTYAQLFAAIGTRWGAGDGFSTFNVPNLSGKFRVGAGPGYALGASGGTAETTLAAANLPAHVHTINHVHYMDHQHGLGNHTHSDQHDHGQTGPETAVHTHQMQYKVDTNNNTTLGGNGTRVTDVKLGTGDKQGKSEPQPERHGHIVPPWGGRTDGPTPNATDTANRQNTDGPSTPTSGSTGNGQAFTNLPPFRAVRVLVKT